MFADTLPAPLRAESPPARACAHCGEPVRGTGEGPGPWFCCSGCASVYAILSECGLESYYERRERAGSSGVRARTSGRSYEQLDQPEFADEYCRRLEGGRLGTELYLENVHCAACVWLVEKTARVLPGVSEARLDLSHGTVRLTWDPLVVPLSRIAAFLDSVGYPCHALHGLDRDALRRREDRRLLMRIGVAGFAAGNAMLLAIAMYAGKASGIEPAYLTLFRWGSVAVALPSLLWSASVFYRGALGALRTFTPHMDLPVSIGIVTGGVSGLVSTVTSRGEIYFDTLTMLVFLLLAGRWLEGRQRRRADGAAELLSALAPSTARLVESGGETSREVPVETVPRGALVEIRAGERIPVDGVVVEGTSSVDLSLLTGESRPARVEAAQSVAAGSVNVSGRLLVRVEKTGQETRLAQLARTVAEAASRRAPTVILANRLAGFFVLGVLSVAVLTVVGYFHVSPYLGVERAVALLVVTCPCALGLATPLAVSAALGRAARSGLMIKGGEPLEALARPGLIVFDKTGTLTAGKLSVVEAVGDASVGPLVAAVESRSAHPIARALSSAFAADEDLVVESTHETLGAGVQARASGREVLVGSPAFVRSNAASTDLFDEAILRLAGRALTPVLVALDGRVVLVLGLGDPVREDARESLEQLRHLGYRLAVLSGDQPAVVRAVVDQIGVPFEEVVGGASPEQKLAFVEDRVRHGPVFMIGDGVNDAAALTAATVGVAVHGGAEASLAAASVFATEGGLAKVVELVLGARGTLRVIRANLIRSLLYNVTVGGLAVAGVVGPLLAAVLMPVSSIGVITASYRARTFGGRP